MKKLSFIIIILMLYSRALAVTAYVDDNGAASWANCQTEVSGTAACSVSEANNNLSAGDTIILRGGNYANQQIIPGVTGTSGNVITYIAYTGETPIFTNTSTNNAVQLVSKNYIRISGITFTGGNRYDIYPSSSDFYEIDNCTFSNKNDNYPPIHPYHSDDGYIHDNIFNKHTYEATGESDEVDDIDCNTCARTRVINNSFTDGGGHTFVVFHAGNSNIIRGNVFNVTTAWDGAADPEKAGIDIGVGTSRDTSFNLIEDNTFIMDTDADDAIRASIWQASRSRNAIFRNNTVIGYNQGIHIYSDSTYTTRTDSTAIYSNSFKNCNRDSIYNEGILALDANNATTDVERHHFVNNIVHTSLQDAFHLMNGDYNSKIFDNEWINNILYNCSGNDVRRFTNYMTLVAAKSSYPSEFVGFSTDESNPLLVDPENGDWGLSAGSPAIDNGAWLTTITSSTGSGTVFTVEFPEYFYDGWSITGETGDTIKTENGQTATIISINYSTGEITVNSSISWTQNEGISLPYNGAKPDIGAIEYGWVLSDLSPTSQQECTSDPRSVTMSCTSPVNANCRHSTDSGDTTYADMIDQFTSGEGTTSHSAVVSQACNGSTKYYIICNDGSDDSIRSEITVDVEAEGGYTAPPGSIIYNQNALSLEYSANGVTIH